MIKVQVFMQIETFYEIARECYRIPPKETQWVLFEFVCEKSLNV
jgi:hypothetical protein